MKKDITLSLCMIIKDEEKTLERCLKSVMTFIDEIIIVDTGSKDSSKEIAKKFNARIFDFKWENNFAKARNFAFSKATKEYILWLDGDDFIDKENIKKLESLFQNFNKNIDFVSGEYILSRDISGNITYSLVRNRIVKRICGFKWIGHVHEYLNVFGNGLKGDFAIEHGKVKKHNDRNLKIFKKMENENGKFTSRDIFYYGNELYDNVEFEEAIEKYTKFLETKDGWIEDKKIAYNKIINCYKVLNKKNKIPEIAFKSFLIDIPTAEICCQIGEYYIEIGSYRQAAFWYRTALDCRHEKENPSIDSKEYYTWIPALQLCVCYFNLDNLKCSYFFNEIAAGFIENSEKIEFNRNYFKKEFAKRNMDMPILSYPLKLSDYINYL